MNLATAALGLSQAAAGISGLRQGSRNAKLMERVGRIEAAEERRRSRRLLGRQIVAAAASGVDPTSGSALDVQAEEALEGEVAALRAAFARESAGAAFRDEGVGRLLAGFGGAGKTLLGGVARDLGRAPGTAPAAAARTRLNVNPANFAGYA